MLAVRMKKGQDERHVGRRMPEPEQHGGFKVVTAMLFGGIEVARYLTLEQAEWRAKQLAAEADGCEASRSFPWVVYGIHEGYTKDAIPHVMHNAVGLYRRPPAQTCRLS
jgi:hypothetical protein